MPELMAPKDALISPDADYNHRVTGHGREPMMFGLSVPHQLMAFTTMISPGRLIVV